jgi:hypothetical protein
MTNLSPEAKFGIKEQSKPGPRTIDQMYSLIIGVVVLVLGIIGFTQTGFGDFTEMTDHAVFGLFQTNGFHSLVYIIFGLFWILGAFALTPAGNQGMNIAVGGALVLVAVLGFLGDGDGSLDGSTQRVDLIVVVMLAHVRVTVLRLANRGDDAVRSDESIVTDHVSGQLEDCLAL